VPSDPVPVAPSRASSCFAALGASVAVGVGAAAAAVVVEERAFGRPAADTDVVVLVAVVGSPIVSSEYAQLGVLTFEED